MYARHQAALADLTRSVLANTDITSLMRQAATLAASTLAVAYSAVWELLPDGTRFVLRSAIGWYDQDIAQAGTIIAPAATTLLAATREHDMPLVVTDWPSETRFTQLALLQDRGLLSSLAVMIPGRGRASGSLSIDVTASRMFSNEEISFVQALAHVLALAIGRVQENDLFAQHTQTIEQQLVAAAQAQAILEERQRLARDLHDSMTQALYGVTLHAQAARRLLVAEETAQAADSLFALQDTAQGVLDEMRLLIFDLRPPILEQAGLAAALQARLEAVEGRANLHTKLVVEGEGELSPQIEQVLYRIAQEALNNALRHARAHHITVRLRQTPTYVMLEIADDGIGFDPTIARGAGGIGLQGIAERVAQVDGRSTVVSSPDTGTQLRVEIPL